MVWGLWRLLGGVERILRKRLYVREVRFARAGLDAPIAPATEQAATIVSIAFPLSVAAVLSLITDVGDDFDPPFYSAVAALLPLLLVAGFAEAGVSLARAIESEPDTDADIDDAIVSQVSGRLVTSVVVGEFGALWALASGESSTFLAALAVLPVLRMAPELVRAHRARFAPLHDERVQLAHPPDT